MLIFPIDHLPRVIPVGVQTSMGVEEIGFYIRPWLEKWPGMTFEVWPTRPTETAAYPAVSHLDGDVLVWSVGDADTAIEGLGTVEVVGIAEGVRKPSGPCTTEIKKTSLGVTQDPPAGIKPYYEDMMEAAQVIREGLDDLNMDMVGSDGVGGLYIITCNGDEPNRTQEEIRAAVNARKTVLLRAGTRVYTYFQETQSSNYDEAAAGKTCPTFVRPARQEDGGLRYYEVQVHEDNTITDRGKIGKTPNPKKLKLTGAVEAEYDGSEEVTVEIPSGIADPGTAHQQLVSDAEGKAVWMPALAYKMSGDVTILSERTGTPSSNGEVGITEPFEGVVEAGKTYKVNYNGTEYETTGVAMEGGNTPDGETIKGVVLGNTAFVGGEDNGLPFVVIYVEPQFQEYIGAYGVILAADGATSVTISITGDSTTYKTIDPVYLPDKRVVTVNATITKMDTNSIEFGEWDTTFADMLAAFNAGHKVRVLCTRTTDDGTNTLEHTYVGRFDAAFYNVETKATIMRLRVPKNVYVDGDFLVMVSAGENGAIITQQLVAD